MPPSRPCLCVADAPQLDAAPGQVEQRLGSRAAAVHNLSKQQVEEGLVTRWQGASTSRDQSQAILSQKPWQQLNRWTGLPECKHKSSTPSPDCTDHPP